MDTQHRWVSQLWDQLQEMSPADRIKVSGDWIIYITQKLSPDLATYRRLEVVELLKDPDWDSKKLAETIGTRYSTIDRLAKDGRRHGAA